jgi:ERCC4-related helicase
VGLGKTIEAGIILSEMWAESKRRILIIVPASLRNQWNLELMEKFHLPSFILDRASFEVAKEQMRRKEEQIYICSYNFAVSNADFFKTRDWNLVVMDEAHKLRNVYQKGNIMANALRDTFANYKKILLTATPLQNNLKELYGLISIIDREFFSSLDTFAEQYNAVSTRDAAKYGELKHRISHIIHRTLRSQVQEYVNFTKRTALVESYYPSDAERELYNKVSDYLLREETFGVPVRQRPLLTLLVRKVMSSSAYALSYTLERFIKRLESYKQTNVLSSALSCVMGDFDDTEDDYAESWINKAADTLFTDNCDIDSEIAELRSYCQMARNIKEESKAKKLLHALEISFEKIVNLGGRRKALIFTESRRTQEYLCRYLRANGYKTVTFNGTNDSDEAKNIYRLWLAQYMGTNRISGSPAIDKKQAIVDSFRNDADVLIATEAGAEGINLQFCSLVVNYDMPWNPQRLEQRIGRCHRYGQKNDVVVVNFVNKANYADCRVYELLDNKFSLFNGVFGASDEVLGAIDSGMDFERRLNGIYNTCRTEREIAVAFDELQAELEDLIAERIKSTRKSLLENFDEEVVNKLRVRQSEDADRMNNYNRHLWSLALAVLSDSISKVDEKLHTFCLTENLSEDIPAATYILNKDSEQYIQLRFGHPLGQYIVKKALHTKVEDSTLVFDLSSLPYRSALVEQHRGRSGYAIAYCVSSTNEYDSEEHLIGCAVTDEGEELPDAFLFKLLDTECIGSESGELLLPDGPLQSNYERQLNNLVEKVDTRTNDYVDFEITKYEMWADDQLVPLQKKVIELSREHDALKRQIRKERTAATKLHLKKEENKLAKLLSQKRSELYRAEDEYTAKVDEMTERLQASMQNRIDSKVMFRFRWTIQ